MEFWEKTNYHRWYVSHRRFSFLSRYCIELYEEKMVIPNSIFKPFLKNLKCHSTNEEKTIFKDIYTDPSLFDQHSTIIVSKEYTNEEKYRFCQTLLVHMKEEEEGVKNHIERSAEK